MNSVKFHDLGPIDYQQCWDLQEEIFKGIVDLVKMKGIVWNDETMGADYETIDIPEDLVDQANEWREKLVEAAAETDDALMEQFFEDSDSITEEQMLTAIRKATIGMTWPKVRKLSFTSLGTGPARKTSARTLTPK